MRVAKALKQADSSTDIRKSGLVSSKQRGTHPHLEKILQKHLQTCLLYTSDAADDLVSV